MFVQYKRELVNPVLNVSNPEAILDMIKLYSFTSLSGVAVKLFKFNFLVKIHKDPVKMATTYLLKLRQSEKFSREIA